MTADERPEPWSEPGRGMGLCTPRQPQAPSQLPGEPNETISFGSVNTSSSPSSAQQAPRIGYRRLNILFTA
ncbi:hypothetical protein [Streptomyces rochei]|uniref:hypothetical protein n=1 Tax=Streptomyces rochei TaxID=1928 RepID=UPI00374A52EC